METIRLIKNNKGDYYLIDPTKGTDANDEGFLLGSSRETNFKKLSKQNCDEIFGVVDVEKLADEITKEYATLTPKAFKRGVVLGINKAMELNKDKVFTLEVVHAAFGQGWERSKAEKNGAEFYSERTRFLKYIQQPTEIEVEIEMQCCGNYSPPCNINCEYGGKPKLDSEGCLILKRVV
jgi:hypothetical protein